MTAIRQRLPEFAETKDHYKLPGVRRFTFGPSKRIHFHILFQLESKGVPRFTVEIGWSAGPADSCTNLPFWSEDRNVGGRIRIGELLPVSQDKWWCLAPAHLSTAELDRFAGLIEPSRLAVLRSAHARIRRVAGAEGEAPEVEKFFVAAQEETWRNELLMAALRAETAEEQEARVARHVADAVQMIIDQGLPWFAERASSAGVKFFADQGRRP